MNKKEENKSVHDGNFTDEKNKLLDLPQLRLIMIDFGKVSVFGEYNKTFTIDSLHNTETLCYKIMPDDGVDPIYRVFSFNKYEGVINPGENLKIKILYNPIIPDTRNVENFEFVDSSFNIMKIKVIGESIGPVLKSSVKEIHFLLTPSEKAHRKMFELKNISLVPAEFSFDCNESGDIFNIKPMKGVIKAERQIYVQVSFVPKEYGNYSHQLFCLVWGGVPLLIELRGVYRKADYEDNAAVRFQSFSLPVEDTKGYRAYMHDCVDTKYPSPYVSQSRNYVYFGRVLQSDDMNSNIDFVTLTNKMDTNVTVKWPEDSTFEVTPKKAEISPHKMASFMCHFFPSCNNTFYQKILTAQIKWEPKTRHGVLLPLTVNVKFQGHSFPEDEFWIPNVTVYPRIITLPPCLPGDTSYTNFKIKVMGHLPVMYRLIPPKKTNFVMKPMVGVINTYEIIAIQFYSEGHDDSKLFQEVWRIELNGRKERRIQLCLRAEISTPKILIGTNNTIAFEVNTPGCQSITNIPVKNMSNYQIRYEFEYADHEGLQVAPAKGFVAANDEEFVKFCYTGVMDGPHNFKLKCKLQAIQRMQEHIGTWLSYNVNITTNCVYQYLTSTPAYHNFGNIELETTLTTEFYIYNLGKNDMNYVLNISYDDGNLDIFTVKPNSGSVKPGENVKIRIKGIANTLGNHSMKISYQNRKHSDSNELVEGGDDIQLFEMTYTAELPTLHIGEIVEHNFGLLFSKEHFWNYLHIERINDYLQNMREGQTESILLQLPEVQVSEDNYYVTLELVNKSVYEIVVSLQRKKICDCTMKEVGISINKSQKVFDCPHRDMLQMELSDTTFYKDSYRYLTINVKYLLPGETTMCYRLNFSHNRTLEMSFIIYSIPRDTFKISSYDTGFTVILKNISVVRIVPPIQTCWFYNNTSQPAEYRIDTTNIKLLCHSEDFEVMKCINPEGVVEPFSAFPLMIRFQPIEIKEYAVQASLICGEDIYKFNIKGRGQMSKNVCAFQSKLPTMSNRCQHFPVIVSHDYMPINSIPIWSSTERVIFLRNTTKDTILKYFWEDYFFRVGISNVVEVTVNNSMGILLPQESQAVAIEIKTFSEACITSLQLSCHFLDYNQLTLYQKCIQQANQIRLQRKERGSFASDETVPEENENIPKHPKPFTKTVVINLHTIHSNDRDGFFSMENQFKNNPEDELSINVSNLLHHDINHYNGQEDNENTIQAQDKGKIQIILEQLIADVVFSNYLPEVLEYSRKLPPPLYKQFTLDERRIIEKKKTNQPLSNEDLKRFRQKQIKKLFTRPKPNLVKKVVKDLIINGIVDSFQLGTVHALPSVMAIRDAKTELYSCPPDCKCINTRKT